MVIYLPSQAVEERPLLDELTPREIVRELDKYVIGQADAKKAVAIALRNRIRRHDWAHRRGEDRDRSPPGKAGQLAVPKSGSQQVH